MALRRILTEACLLLGCNSSSRQIIFTANKTKSAHTSKKMYYHVHTSKCMYESVELK
jgi:hypothetical protein